MQPNRDTDSVKAEPGSRSLFRLTAGYIIALSLIALLYVFSHLMMERVIKTQESDATVINLAGRQRMLSQKISSTVAHLVSISNERQRNFYISQLALDFKVFSEVHRGLQGGSDLYKLPGQNNHHIIRLFHELEPFYQQLKLIVSRIVDNPSNPALGPEAIVPVETAAARFLQIMDSIVNEYDRSARQKVERLGNYHYVLLVSILTLLICEAFFIFRPLVREVSFSQKKLDDVNKALHDELEERSRMSAQLEHALASKNEFMAIASHDLRSPLTSIIGFAQIVQASLRTADFSPEELQSLMDRIIRQSYNMKRLVEDYLDLQVLEEGQLQLCKTTHKFNDIVMEVIENLENQALKRSLTIRTELDQEVELVRIDSDRIRQVFENMLGNAFKFSPQDSEVLVKTSRDREVVSFSVSDSGPGLPDEGIEHLFEHYYRAGPQREDGDWSMGLGLAICNKIISLHGGTMSADNLPDMGACFRFSIPLGNGNSGRRCQSDD